MQQIYAWIEKLYRLLGVMLLVALIGVVLGGIVSRELLSVSLVWSNEVAINLFVWLVFIGAGVAMAQNNHIRLTLVLKLLPVTPSALLVLGVTYVGMALLLGLWLTGAYLAVQYSGHRFTTLDVSASWTWAAVPGGLTLMILSWIRHGAWTRRGAERALPDVLGEPTRETRA